MTPMPWGIASLFLAGLGVLVLVVYNICGTCIDAMAAGVLMLVLDGLGLVPAIIAITLGLAIRRGAEQTIANKRLGTLGIILGIVSALLIVSTVALIAVTLYVLSL